MPQDVVFGARSLQGNNEWNAAKCIRGEPSERELQPDHDLGRCAKPGSRNMVRRADDMQRSFGCPTVRTDIPMKKLKSVADHQNYGDERTNPMGAAALAPSMASADYTDIGALQQVGQAREAQAGAQLQDQIDRHNFEQTEERQRLADYAAMVAGGSFGGTSSSTQPIYSNSAANALGLASSGVGIANGLFGQNGLFPGFLNP